MTPLISVITPFFNVDLFLEEAINSVRNQDYTNWEMILIDDGSTDESSRIAKEYALAYPGKIIYTSHSGHSNKGASASRNHGISISSGSLVAFIDADDVWLEGKLSAQVKLLSDYPQAVMVCEASQYWESWQPTGKKDRLIMVGKEQNKLFPPPQLAEKLYPLGEGFAPCPSSIIIRRSILEKYCFEENFKGIYQLYEDQVFLLKVYLNEVVFISSQCNNRYRLREGSCVQRVNAEGNYDVVRKYFLEWLETYLAEKKLSYPGVWKLLNRAKRKYSLEPLNFVRKLFRRKLGVYYLKFETFDNLIIPFLN